MKSNFRNCGVKIEEKQIVQVAAKRDNYRHSRWQSNSLYNFRYGAVVLGALSMEHDLTGLGIFCRSVHHLIRERHSLIPTCFLILYCNERRRLSYNKCSTPWVQPGAWQQLPFLCWVLATWVCIGMRKSTAGEKGRQPQGLWKVADDKETAGAAKGCDFSVQGVCNTSLRCSCSCNYQPDTSAWGTGLQAALCNWPGFRKQRYT